MSEKLTLAALLSRGAGQLQRTAGDTSVAAAQLDAEVLLAHATNLSRSRLRSHPESEAQPLQQARYAQLLTRRAAGEPIAYLTGRREFWSLPLKVSPAVLIPRPETELLVERALQLSAAPRARAADLGTGCGAIALALARERPGWHLVAADICAEALQVARTNAAMLALTQIEFRHASWYEALRGERFDLLLSNPPYIAAADPALARGALTYEPVLALLGGEDGLDAIRVLAQGAAAHLAPAGWLLLEHGADQGEAVRAELVLAGLAHVRSHRDLAGLERMTEGQHGQI